MTQSNAPLFGNKLPKRGNQLTKVISVTLLALFGWRIVGYGTNTPKMVLIGAPHTSNWDFILTILAMFALGIRFSWVVKHTIFKWPFVRLLNWLGGIGVDRSTTKGFVGEMVEEFKKREQLLLAIMPEGTRSKVKGWRSGFYYIAHGAQVPIYMVIFDYGRKELRLGPEFRTSGNFESDLPLIQAYFADATGKVPDK